MPTHPLDICRVVAATRAINKVPNNYGLLRSMGLFRDEGISSTLAELQTVNGVLNLLPVKERGAEPTLNENESRDFRYVKIPHVPVQDRVWPDDVRQARDFLTGEKQDTMVDKRARVMINLRNKLAITQEWLISQALTGLLKNDDGTTIANLYSILGVQNSSAAYAPEVFDFAFTTATTDVRGKVFDLKDHIESNLLGETMSGIMVVCSPAWFKALVGHAKVEKAYEGYAKASQMIGGDVRRSFEFASEGGVPLYFQSYTGQVTDKSGNVRKFIADDEAIAFPMGTQDTFVTYWGPPVLGGTRLPEGTKGVIGMYALETDDPKGRFMDVDAEMNCLPLVKRPEVLCRLTKS
jgi:hypothetical protein